MSERNQLILKMTKEQISEGEARFKAFLATNGLDEKLPAPSFVGHLKLNGISGSAGQQLAIINNHTFAAGEAAQVKADGRMVQVRCVSIEKDSVVIEAKGVEKQIVLKLR